MAFKVLNSIEWNLNLNGPFKFKFNPHHLNHHGPAIQHTRSPSQPTFSLLFPARPSLVPSSPFPSAKRSPQATVQPSRPHRTAPLHLPPGAADKRGPLVSFPFFLPQLPRSRCAFPFACASAPARVTGLPRALPVPAPRHGSETAAPPVSATEPRREALAAPHRRDAAPRPGTDAPALAPRIRSPSRSRETLAASITFLLLPSPHQKRRRRSTARRGTTPLRQSTFTRPAPERRHRVRPRPACTNPPPRQTPRQRAPPVSVAAAPVSLVLPARCLAPPMNHP
jgi:hypothetical protein